MKKQLRTLAGLVLIGASAMLTSCSDNDDNVTAESTPSAVETKAWPTDGYGLADVAPGDNFFMHCNGAWWNSTELKDGEMVGMVYDNLKNNTKVLENQAAANYAPLQRLKNLESLIGLSDPEGVEAIKANIQSILTATTPQQLWQNQAQIIKAGGASPFRLYANVIAYSKGHTRTNVIVYADSCSNHQYLNTEALLNELFADEIGDSMAAVSSVPVLQMPSLEEISEASVAAALEQQPAVTRAAEADHSQLFDYILADALGIGNSYVRPTEFDQYCNTIVNLTLEEQKQYCIMSQINDLLMVKPEYCQIVTDTLGQHPKASQRLAALSNYMSPYMKSYAVSTYCVDDNVVQQYTDMCERLRTAFAQRIDSLDWMSATTKAAAHKKLDAMTMIIGKSDNWVESALPAVDAPTLYGNINQLRQAQLNLYQALSTKSYDVAIKHGYALNSYQGLATANAFYMMFNNSLLICPAFLMPPFYSTDYPDAYNYAMLSVSGHELTHGFDSNGSKFDYEGYVYNWWTVNDQMEFEERCKKLVECYNHLQMYPEEDQSLYGNGTNTLGENIADLGGALAMFDALTTELKAKGFYGDELTTQQKNFFLGYANMWRNKYSYAQAVNAYSTDSHSQSRERVNGVVMNIDKWYELFEVTNLHQLYLAPSRRAYIW